MGHGAEFGKKKLNVAVLSSQNDVLLTNFLVMPAMPNTFDLKTILSIIIAVVLLLIVLVFTSLNMKPATTTNLDEKITPSRLQSAETSSLTTAPEQAPPTHHNSVTVNQATTLVTTRDSLEKTDETATPEQLSLKAVEDKTLAKQRENTELRDRAEQLEKELQRKMQSLQDVN